jgi:hypothetical protein
LPYEVSAGSRYQRVPIPKQGQIANSNLKCDFDPPPPLTRPALAGPKLQR